MKQRVKSIGHDDTKSSTPSNRTIRPGDIVTSTLGTLIVHKIDWFDVTALVSQNGVDTFWQYLSALIPMPG